MKITRISKDIKLKTIHSEEIPIPRIFSRYEKKKRDFKWILKKLNK